MGLRLITPPDGYPVSLALAKKHLREVDDDNDDLIGLYLAAATEYCDGAGGFLGRALLDQTWELVLDEFPSGEDLEIKIPLPPLIEVVSIKYDDSAGVEQTIDDGDYTVDNVTEPGWVLPRSAWPSALDAVNSVRVRFRAGYVNADSPVEPRVPSAIKNAILILMAENFRNREASVIGASIAKVPWSAEQLLRRYRIDLSMA